MVVIHKSRYYKVAYPLNNNNILWRSIIAPFGSAHGHFTIKLCVSARHIINNTQKIHEVGYYYV